MIRKYYLIKKQQSPVLSKPDLVRTVMQNFTCTKNDLHHEMCFIDFAHSTTTILVPNNKANLEIQNTNGMKF